MKTLKRSTQGFTLIELMITIGILGILAAVAIPSYQNYTRRAYFSEIVSATTPYKLAISECYQNLGTVTGCDAGSNLIPTSITTPQGGVASLAVANGVITVTPVAQHGLATTDTYVLTPTVSGTTLTWASSGGAVTNGYAQ